MEEKKGKGFKKVALSVVCGILFGLFAAISFYAVNEVGTALGISDKSAKVEANIEKSENILKEDVKEVVASDSSDNSDEETSDLLHTGKTSVVTNDVSDVVEDKMPTIVSIVNNYTSTNYFYYQSEEQASGSGIIVGENDSELLIVTNYHVVTGNNSLEVTFCDGEVVNAQVKGTDSEMDLAVIAVPLEDLKDSTLREIDYATIGDSDDIKVGEPVIAIGNALGYGQSVTTGVVSAKDREISGTSGTFIQTDAAINPGNSGGALMNINGEVIGINSNKIGGSSIEGMGYAIPISAAKPIIEELMQEETKVEVAVEKQGYLGISGATITSEEATFYGYPEGVYVASVVEDAAADKAGIRKGDFITEFDGESITSMEQLKKLISCYEGGQTVEVVILRYTGTDYEEMTLDVELGYKAELENS